MSTPQVIVSLTPFGGLKIELPGIMGTRRSIELAPGQAEATLQRILQAQMESQVEIGLDGAPTKAQLDHWELHNEWPRAQCRFCLAEGRIRPSRPKGKVLIAENPGGIQIYRKVAKPSKAVAMAKSIEELGL